MSTLGNRRYFVTGTDTGVGKTFVSAALLARAGNLGLTTNACKPVAAGADRTADGLRNEDALTLLDAIDLPMVYPAINPVCLEPAIAPHIAAADAGVELSVDGLLKAMAPFLAMTADFSLIEGAGGWRVPLNHRETLADLALSLELPVILVVSMKLGAINHALLTAEAIARDGLRLAGWVANQPHAEPMSRYQENLTTLTALLSAPLLGEIAFQPDQDFWRAAELLRLPDGLESPVGGG